MTINQSSNHKTDEKSLSGFASVELIIAIIAVVAIGVVGFLVINHKSNNKAANAPQTSSSQIQSGTTSSVDQLTQEDAAAEAKTDKSQDSSIQQNSTGANSAASDVGGAYNESSL